MGDGVDTGGDDLAGRRGEDGGVRPDGDALAVGLGGDGGDQVRVEVRVDLDGRGVRTTGHGDREGQVGGGGDGLHPGHFAGHGALGDLVGARVVEEPGARHQGGVADVGAGDLADEGGTGEVADLPQVVGHVPDGGDAAVDVTAQRRLGRGTVGRGGEVLVGVDQPGDDEASVEVEHPGAVGEPGGEVGVGRDRGDRLPVGDDRGRGPERAAGAVEEGRAAVDRGRAAAGAA